jgi:hypothetical protein
MSGREVELCPTGEFDVRYIGIGLAQRAAQLSTRAED